MAKRLLYCLLSGAMTPLVFCVAMQKDSYAIQHVQQKNTTLPTIPAAENSSCPEDFCICEGSVANCSYSYGRLTFIPALPRKIRHLIFVFNNLSLISDERFFRNATRLVSIDLRSNGLEFIHPQAFKSLTRLEELRLDRNNRLSYTVLRAVFSARNIKRLFLRGMDLGPVPKDFFQQARPASRLMVVDLSENRLQNVDFSLFSSLRHLTELWLGSSQVTYTLPGRLLTLQRLVLSSNALLHLPESCRNGSSLFPRLFRLEFNENSLSEFSSPMCFPSLGVLKIDRNRVSTMTTDMFGRDRFPALRHLSLEYMDSITTIQRYAFRSASLQSLSLMYCSIPFSDKTIHPDCFAGMPNLTLLQVSHNLGSYIPDSKFSRLFGAFASLQQLYMGAFGLQRIHKDTFSNLTRLQILYLYRNKLTEIPDGAFDSLRDLKELGLNDNQIVTIRETTFSRALRNRLRHFDVSGNLLQCDCDLLWFQTWFRSSPGLFRRSYRNYTCDNLPGTLLSTFTLNTQACFLSREAYKFIMASVGIFVSLLAAVSAFYQWRWHIRLLLYEAFRGRGEIQRRRRLQTGTFDFDVFVSYAKNDLWWVRHHLMPELEGRLGLRLCVHERDFLPGNNIVDNIVECVQRSKKVLVVFSRHFVLSPWCQFELALCLRHVIETDDALLVTCLEDMTSLAVTRTMVAVLKTTTYIQWHDSPNAKAAFWGRLEMALNELYSTKL